MPTIEDKNDKVTDETTNETTDAATDEITIADDDGDDDVGSEELEEIFTIAPEKDGEEEVGKSVTAEADGAEEVKPGDETAQAAEETTNVPKVEVTAEEPAKEEPTVEQPTVEPPAPLDTAKVLEDYQKWRGDAEELLASNHYNLTTEQAEEFDTDPGSAIPKLAARLHMEVMHQSVAMMAQILPQIMANVTRAQTAEASNEEAFFSEWPELKGHRDQVVRLGAVYVKMNPGATLVEFTRDVGAQVAVSMKVDLSSRQPQPSEAPRPKPHTPLAASGGNSGGAPVVKPGLFEDLDADAEALEQG